jgi:hypothetical protein
MSFLLVLQCVGVHQLLPPPAGCRCGCGLVGKRVAPPPPPPVFVVTAVVIAFRELLPGCNQTECMPQCAVPQGSKQWIYV